MQASHTDRLLRAIQAPEAEATLLDTALAIAAVEYPELDAPRYRQRLDQWGEALRQRVDGKQGLEEIVQALNDFLFEELGFSGNRHNYYDPRNSYINDVLDRKLGIPLTLSIIYIELGRRIGLPFCGVCFPGHFLVKLTLREGAVVLDPFNGGISLSEADLGELLSIVSNNEREDFRQLLTAARKQDIVVRMLRNLKAVHQRAGQLDKALMMTNLILAIDKSLVPEYRDRGLLLAELDCSRAAIEDLARYLKLNPADPDADAIRALLEELISESTPLH